jgi:type IV pilus assembly protein PilV
MSLHTKQQGFTLIEVLVTMVIMAVGLLGLAGLQVTSLRNTESAYQRSQASLLANDILDRMRANSTGVGSGDYNDIDTTAPLSATDCGANVCTPTQMATYDDSDWHAQIASLLPSGTGSVTGNGANSVFTITITWDDNRSGNADTSFTLSSRI